MAEIVERELAFIQALREFTGAIWRLDLIEFAVNLFVSREQAELGGAMHQNFILNQLAQNAQAKTGRLLIAQGLARSGGLALKILLDIGGVNLLAVHGRGNIVAHTFQAARYC